MGGLKKLLWEDFKKKELKQLTETFKAECLISNNIWDFI